VQRDESPKISVLHNEAERRFEAHVGDHVAHADYLRSGSTITFTHTEVPPELEAQGIGSELVRVALEFAKAQKLAVRPRCTFVRAFIRKHPEYQSLVEAE
jgi:predicted GNAT family acetyltransferase